MPKLQKGLGLQSLSAHLSGNLRVKSYATIIVGAEQREAVAART
jgi:hypothetical protein